MSVLTASDSSSSQTHQSLAPARGVTAPAQDGASYRFLSDVIMARGLVDPAAMKSALQASLAGRGLTEILVERGDLSEDDLARALAEHHGLDHVDLDLFDVDAAASAIVEPDLARRLGAVPIAIAPGGALVVAVHDPTGSPAVRELADVTDRPIWQVIVSRAQLAAAISSLQRPASGAPQVAATPPSGDVRAEDPRAARSVPAASMHPADLLRPSAPPPPPVAPMPSRIESDERLRAVDQHVQATELQVRELRDAARSAEQRAKTAEATMSAANARAEGLMAAAVAANEALARLVGNCERLEREAEAREGEMLALRSELDLERTERARLKTRLLETLPGNELIALNVRVAELERELAEARSATSIAHAARDQAPVAQPEAYVAPSAEPADEVQAPEACVAPVKAPVVEEPPAAEPVVEELAEEPLAEEPVAPQVPSYAPTIDIPGTPGVPYVRALAPMPPVAQPRKPAKSAKDEAKAKGLRRLIGALKRG